MPIALGAVFYLATRTRKILHLFLIGWTFGLVFFLLGLWWVYAALSGHVGFSPLPALLLTVLFCSVLSLATALPTALAGLCQNTGCRLFSLAALWTIAEWCRGWWFTGFPWLSFGYSQIPNSPFAAWTPLLGIHGVSWALLMVVACALAAFHWRRNRQALPALAAAIFILTAPALVPDGHRQSGGELRVSLLQGNVAQTLKWDPDQVIKALSDYQKMAQETGEQLIILPETAWPVPFYSLPQEYVAGWHDIATEQQGMVIAGVFLEEGDDTYNAAVLLDGEQVKDYRKTHLTPYGEYQPFPDLARRWLRSEAIQFSGLTAGEENKTLTLPGGTQAGMSICYEDAFGDEWREQLPHAHFLVNITNDAWFDTTAMPYQHLQISQARALETGRWLVRAANTGVTAIINERGEVVRALPLKSQEALTGTIQLRQGATPYVLIGDTGIALIAGLMLLAAAVVDRRKRASPNS